MGLLVVGTPLDWDASEPHRAKVKHDGITQFLALYDRLKDRKADVLYWGDEIEYLIVSFDDARKEAFLSLSQGEILTKLAGVVHDLQCDESKDFDVPTFHPEFGRYMLESTPGAPYDVTVPSLLSVEANMRLRRQLARRYLTANELPMTLTAWPRLGVTDSAFCDPHIEVEGGAMQSLFVSDEVINKHIRFPTLAANIRRRRGSKVAINVPIFKDVHTPSPFIDPTIPWDRTLYPADGEAKAGAARPDHIYMDAMAFGMGCCCLQITFQAKDLEEATKVYDQLVPVAPIMLALSAASPAFRGYLADVDCRWDVIAGSVDDRTPGERGLAPLKEGERRIPKSRYDSVDSYISSSVLNRPEYSDNEVPIDEAVKERLLAHGIDAPLAHHVAHLFIRDPLVIFTETLDQDDALSTDHFENIQSTNWQTLRFKPPPPHTDIGWRVEFRSMEVQPTDFENAAYSVFIVLLTRAILSFGLNFYMPISKVDENMARAQKRNAVTSQKFFFRKSVSRRPAPTSASARSSVPSSPTMATFSAGASALNGNGAAAASSSSANGAGAANGSTGSSGRQTRPPSPELGPIEDEYEEMTADEILNGKPGTDFVGLVGLVTAYVDSLEIDLEARCQLAIYLDLVRNRASGKLVTPAAYYRRFITSHPAYKGDSVVSPEICYDLAKEVDELERGVRRAPDFLPASYRGTGQGTQTPRSS